MSNDNGKSNYHKTKTWSQKKKKKLQNKRADNLKFNGNKVVITEKEV